jgi:hypothetical protein
MCDLLVVYARNKGSNEGKSPHLGTRRTVNSLFQHTFPGSLLLDLSSSLYEAYTVNGVNAISLPTDT